MAVSLTAREGEVLQKVADTDTLGEAAAALGLTYSMLNTHLDHIRTKFDVHTTPAAVEAARALKFIS